MKRLLLWSISVISLLFMVSCHPAAQPTIHQPKPMPIFKDSHAGNRVALTWDDGPDRHFTPQILDILKENHVKGTFFLIGSRAAALPEITKRIEQEGHAIGNHTYWHPNMVKEGLPGLYWQVNETEKVLSGIIGHRTRLFRAPYGILNEALLEKLDKMNYTVIGWSVDSLDWKQLSADEVERNVMSKIHPGSIVLLHSGGNWNQDLSGSVQALARIIPKLKKEGIELVSIPELLHISNWK